MLPREEKTEQLVDTRHEVDQLVLELQKVKQEVSGKVCVRAHVWCACVHVWCVCMPRGQGGWDTPVTVLVCMCVCACQEGRVAGTPQ